MEDEIDYLQSSIRRYQRLLGATADERAMRVLERLIREAEERLREIDRQRERR